MNGQPIKGLKVLLLLMQKYKSSIRKINLLQTLHFSIKLVKKSKPFLIPNFLKIESPTAFTAFPQTSVGIASASSNGGNRQLPSRRDASMGRDELARCAYLD